MTVGATLSTTAVGAISAALGVLAGGIFTKSLSTCASLSLVRRPGGVSTLGA